LIPSRPDAQIRGKVLSATARNHQGQPYAHLPTSDYGPQMGPRLDGSRRISPRPYAHIWRNILRWARSGLKVDELKIRFASHETYIDSRSKGAIVSINRCQNQEEYWDLQVPGTNNYVTIDGAIHHNSGKSVACAMDLMIHALQQPRGNDGWARTRAVIVRNSYPELKSTTIKTWLEFFPEETFGKMNWGSPITQLMDLGDKRTLEAIFLAIDRPMDTKKLLSLETSYVWLNEVRELPKAVLDGASGRVGRYPSAKNGAGVFHPCLIMDTNPPADDHWFAELDKETPEDWEFFHQPGGLSLEAENLNWLNQDADTILLPFNHPDRLAKGRVYYERLIGGKDENWCKVYVHGEYGSTSADRPVFPEYSDKIHHSDQILGAYPALPLYLGWDFGLTPAVVIAQVSAKGQMRILDEVIGENIGLSQFIDTMVRPLIAMKYPKYKLISLHDPAGVQRSQADEVTCRQILKHKGMNPSAVGTNAFGPRREAVAYYLTRLIDGEPAFLLSSTVRQLRKGLSGDYKYMRINVPGEERYKDQPMKNMSSHVSDALQYLCIHHHNPGRPEKARAIPSHNKYKSGIAGY